MNKAMDFIDKLPVIDNPEAIEYLKTLGTEDESETAKSGRNELQVIKPCPFCGGKAEVLEVGLLILNPDTKKAELTERTVICKICKSSVDHFNSESLAIAWWNKRAL